MKRFIEILVLVSFFSYLVGDIFYSRVIEKNWNIKQGQYPEKMKLHLEVILLNYGSFCQKKDELLANVYSLMGIKKLSDYNNIAVGDWESLFLFNFGC